MRGNDGAGSRGSGQGGDGCGTIATTRASHRWSVDRVGLRVSRTGARFRSAQFRRALQRQVETLEACVVRRPRRSGNCVSELSVWVARDGGVAAVLMRGDERMRDVAPEGVC